MEIAAFNVDLQREATEGDIPGKRLRFPLAFVKAVQNQVEDKKKGGG